MEKLLMLERTFLVTKEDESKTRSEWIQLYYLRFFRYIFPKWSRWACRLLLITGIAPRNNTSLSFGLNLSLNPLWSQILPTECLSSRGLPASQLQPALSSCPNISPDAAVSWVPSLCPLPIQCQYHLLFQLRHMRRTVVVGKQSGDRSLLIATLALDSVKDSVIRRKPKGDSGDPDILLWSLWMHTNAYTTAHTGRERITVMWIATAFESCT